MIIKDEFFKNEVRDGFFVSSLMKRAWAAELEILNDLDIICKENNIKYFIGYGTLLGAVRHGGFIPWDDDIDVMMLREDYEKFRTLAKEGKFPFEYRLNSMYSSEYYNSSFDHFAASGKVIDFNDEQMEKYHGFPFAGGIDIFPIDNLPNYKIKEYKDHIGTLVDVIYNLDLDSSQQINSRLIELLEKKYSKRIDKSNHVLNQLYKILDKETAKTGSGENAAYILEWFIYDFKREFKRDWFLETVNLNFEGFEFPAPKEYDLILKALYSDYNKKVRGSDNHEYPFFRKRQEYVSGVTGTNITNYDAGKYNFAALASKREKSDNKTKLLNKIEILNNTMDIIFQIENESELNNLFEQMQAIAINIGEYIEDRFSESLSKRLVKYLEDYCEAIYELSLSQNEDDDIALFEKAKSLLSSLAEDLQLTKENGIRKIAFVFENENDWKHYKRLYGLLSEDEEIKCIIMQIPYLMLNNQLSANEEQMHFDDIDIEYEKDAADYRSFDFGKEQIDCIIKSNPYDEFSFGDIIHPFFYTENLKKICDTVIHVPTLDIVDFTVEDMQMKEMSEYFVKTPGTVNADYTLLQSKTNTDTYIRILKELSEEVKWEERILYCENDEKTAERIKSIVL